MGRLSIQFHKDLIDIAPPPPFRRIIAFDDGVPRRVKMLGRVPVGRVVAAADVTTRPAQTQMHPGRPKLQTFLATERAGDDIADVLHMFAFHRHLRSSNRRGGVAAHPREIGVQRGHDLSAFADSDGDTFDRAGAHVADGEYSGTVRFQHMATVLTPGRDEAYSGCPPRGRSARDPMLT